MVDICHDGMLVGGEVNACHNDVLVDGEVDACHDDMLVGGEVDACHFALFKQFSNCSTIFILCFSLAILSQFPSLFGLTCL